MQVQHLARKDRQDGILMEPIIFQDHALDLLLGDEVNGHLVDTIEV
jgi:hypothetical protein